MASLSCVFAAKISHAIEAADIADALRVKPELRARTTTETKQFCRERVTRLPRLTSAGDWQAFADRKRNDVLANVVFRGKGAEWRDAKRQVVWGDEIAGGPGYKIRKLRYEAVPGMWIPALLYEPEKLTGRVPGMLNVNGHDGAGKAADYKQARCINMAKRGMLVMNVEWIGMGQLKGADNTHYRLNQLDLCGTSGVGVFFLAMQRGLDILAEHEHADPKRLGVAGLSGGGWQTIFLSSLDTRVSLANPVAGYSSFLTRIDHLTDLGDSEQTPCDLAKHADYLILTAMLAPRAALLTFNEKDNCCFASGHALAPLRDGASAVYKLLGKPERLRDHVNVDPGTHNFGRDNREALYRAIQTYFYDGSAEFSPVEIDVAKELKKGIELDVPLPPNNATLQSLGMRLSENLPREKALPESAEMAKSWRENKVDELGAILSAERYTASTVGNPRQKLLGDVTFRKTDIEFKSNTKEAKEWNALLLEFAPPKFSETVLVIGDGGRSSLAEQIAARVSKGERVVAFDPFYFGDCQPTSHDFLWGLLISSVGERPLGIQASQVAAVAKMSKGVKLVAYGPRSSVIALAASALAGDSVAAVELHNSYGSLREVIESGQGANSMPEMFCFGLLERFDVLQLAALSAPRTVTFVAPSERAKKELAPLAAYYSVLGAKHEPLGKE